MSKHLNNYIYDKHTWGKNLNRENWTTLQKLVASYQVEDLTHFRLADLIGRLTIIEGNLQTTDLLGFLVNEIERMEDLNATV